AGSLPALPSGAGSRTTMRSRRGVGAAPAGAPEPLLQPSRAAPSSRRQRVPKRGDARVIVGAGRRRILRRAGEGVPAERPALYTVSMSATTLDDPQPSFATSAELATLRAEVAEIRLQVSELQAGGARIAGRAL